MSDQASEHQLHRRRAAASLIKQLCASRLRELDAGDGVDPELVQLTWDAIESGVELLIERLPRDACARGRW